MWNDLAAKEPQPIERLAWSWHGYRGMLIPGSC